ncbi:hypothetical protein VSDG_00770 [Cytospora chrysosperma]|uniref:Protein kinase domain-containing protein n=1 Tax=Cytospora chrysosperma TaxID=252740 RepID=A0A423WM27_CYTCH|nr:hypothetical protein VSDG_00770 [Valsa sordida]
MDRTLWFDTPRIEDTVTRQFACSQLLPDEVELLDRPLAFGDGLTDCTYWEWIQSKAKRLFLILVDLDLADQIFGVVDDSWEDDDLPIALDQVERLSLTAARDPRTERKFYQRQFHYLLRPLERGQHADYEDHEVVPLDVHERRPGPLAAQNHDVDRVGLPNHPGAVFCRRRFPVGPEADCVPYEAFMSEISSAGGLQNEHVASYWASYTHQGYGYVLFAPASEYRLSAYLANTPSSVKGLDKLARRRMVLDWIHCLVDTICFMHSRGLSLGNIKPSAIFFTHTNHIFLSPPSRLSPDTAAGSSQANSFDKEAYDYAAPEQRARMTKHTPIPIRSRTPGPSSSRGSTIPPGGSIISISRSRRSSRAGGGGGPADHHQQQQHKLAPSVPGTPPQRPSSSSSASSSHNNIHHHHHHHHHSGDLPAATSPLDPQAADIFSAGCVILELLSHGLLKRSASSFASHRGARHKIAGRGGAVLDSSFHRNLGQVETWMGGLARDAGKKAGSSSKKKAAIIIGGGGDGRDGRGGKEEGARLFRGVTPILHVVERMLSPHPPSRPSAPEVQRAIYQVLTEVSGVAAPHCAHHRYDGGSSSSNGNGGVVAGGAGAPRDVSGAAMATIDEGAISPTTSPPGFDFSGSHQQYHHRANTHDDDPGTKRSSSLRSFVGIGHRRDASDESSRSKSSSGGSGQSHWGERRDTGGGLRQNLRISKSWQPNVPAERDIASRHSR